MDDTTPTCDMIADLRFFAEQCPPHMTTLKKALNLSADRLQQYTNELTRLQESFEACQHHAENDAQRYRAPDQMPFAQHAAGRVAAWTAAAEGVEQTANAIGDPTGKRA